MLFWTVFVCTRVAAVAINRTNNLCQNVPRSRKNLE